VKADPEAAMTRCAHANAGRLERLAIHRLGTWVGLLLAGLLIAAPLRADPRETPGGFAPGTVIYPQGAGPTKTEPLPADSGNSRGWLLAVAGALAAGGVWVLWRRRATEGLRGVGRAIVVEETRSLGNRQYLVVAACDGRRFLLGVTPGRIQLVAPLDERKPEDAS
jgi:flagellar protein FliO/FliZ